MSTPMPDKNLVTMAEAARYCGNVHPITIRRAISAGRISGYRIGAKILVDLNEVDERLLMTIPTADGVA